MQNWESWRYALKQYGITLWTYIHFFSITSLNIHNTDNSIETWKFYSLSFLPTISFFSQGIAWTSTYCLQLNTERLNTFPISFFFWIPLRSLFCFLWWGTYVQNRFSFFVLDEIEKFVGCTFNIEVKKKSFYLLLRFCELHLC